MTETDEQLYRRQDRAWCARHKQRISLSDGCPDCAADWHRYDSEDDPCPECGGGEEPDSWRSACFDDMCHGGEVPCMHGDYATLPCGLCGKRP